MHAMQRGVGEPPPLFERREWESLNESSARINSTCVECFFLLTIIDPVEIAG